MLSVGIFSNVLTGCQRSFKIAQLNTYMAETDFACIQSNTSCVVANLAIREILFLLSRCI